MSYDKNDNVSIETRTGKMEGTIRDRFIQVTELEYDGETLLADASEENPVYLVELENGKKEMVAENSLSPQ